MHKNYRGDFSDGFDDENITMHFKTAINKYRFHAYITLRREKGDAGTMVRARLKSAFANVVDLCEGVLEMKIAHDQFFNIAICGMEKTWGTFDVTDNKITINEKLLDGDLRNFERTVFHEIMHYLFVWLHDQILKGRNWFSLLSEAVTRYFENMYYPDGGISEELLTDRAN